MMTKKQPAIICATILLLAGTWALQSQELVLRAGSQSSKEGEPRFEVKLDEATGNYIFHYDAPDGTPVEVVFVPATKIKPEVKASFSVDPQTEETTYGYRISNARSSEQELHTFAVRVSRPIDSLQTPEGWRGFKPNPRTETVLWSYMRGLTLEDGLVKPGGLLQGDSQDGFSFQSLNLPGVVAAYLRGNTKETPKPPGITHEIRKQMWRYTWWENDSVIKFTIGPAVQVTDLEPFNAEIVVGRIRTHVLDKAPGSMLPSEELRQSLYQKLVAARAALREEQTAAAKEYLGAILEELTYQPETNISLELLEALVIDIKFVLSKLP